MPKLARKTKQEKRRPKTLARPLDRPRGRKSTGERSHRGTAQPLPIGHGAYDIVVRDGELAFVMVPVVEYEAWVKKCMAYDAITQIEKGQEDLIDADDLALEFAADSIAQARKRAGLSQKQLGEKLGIPQSQVSRIERNPDHTTVRTMRRVAKALGVDVAAFMRYVDR